MRIDGILKKLNERLFFGIMVVLVVGALIPIYVYALYTVPLADDYNMTAPVYHTWMNTGSLFAAIATAWEEALMRYRTWSGEYLCMFLQGLPSGLGDYRLYFISSWLIVSVFVSAIFYMGKVFIVDFLGSTKRRCFIITSVIFLYLLTFLPEIYDAFFWHTTSVSYTLSFAVKVFLITVSFQMLFVSEKIGWAKVAVLAVLNFVAAGVEGSFSHTSFFLLMSLFLLVCLIKKQNRIIAGILWFTTTVGWAVVLLAPGNMARQDGNYGNTTGLMAVIWESLHRGVETISDNMSIVLVLVTMLIIPVIYSCVKESTCEFRAPGLVTLYSVGIYASTYAPWIFSRGVEAPSPYGGDSGYIQNVFWMTFVLLWFANVIYWIGWMSKHVTIGSMNQKSANLYSKAAFYGVILGMLFFWSLKLEHVMEYTSPRLLWHIANGNAARYYSVMEEREKIYTTLQDEVEDVIVPIADMPIPTGGAGDITSDATNWVNQGVQFYYGLECGVRTE